MFFALTDLPCSLPHFQAHLVWLPAILSLVPAATRTDLLLCSLSTDNHRITHMPPLLPCLQPCMPAEQPVCGKVVTLECVLYEPTGVFMNGVESAANTTKYLFSKTIQF